MYDDKSATSNSLSFKRLTIKMKYAPADFKIRNAQLSSPKDKPRYVAHGFYDADFTPISKMNNEKVAE